MERQLALALLEIKDALGLFRCKVVVGLGFQGELLRWGGFALERQQQIGFHKLKAIAFDKKGNLWALNTASELAVWNEELREWDIKVR